MARKKSPNAPKWRNIDVTPCPLRGVAFWTKMFNTNAIYQLRRTLIQKQPPRSRRDALRFERQLRTEENAFNRATEAASPSQGQSRSAAKSARWNGLTFDTKGGIIISSSGARLCPRT